VAGVKLPERLYRDVEGTSREAAETQALLEEHDEIERRLAHLAVAVEPGQRRIGPVEAEHRLEPLDLHDAARHQKLRGAAVGMGEDEARARP
jgi:hypothetical protein